MYIYIYIYPITSYTPIDTLSFEKHTQHFLGQKKHWNGPDISSPSLVASATQDEKWQWCVAETKKTKKQKTTKVG